MNFLSSESVRHILYILRHAVGPFGRHAALTVVATVFHRARSNDLQFPTIIRGPIKVWVCLDAIVIVFLLA